VKQAGQDQVSDPLPSVRYWPKHFGSLPHHYGPHSSNWDWHARTCI